MKEHEVENESRDSRVREMLRRPAVQGFLWGLGSAVVAAYVWPRVRGKVRPFMVGAMSELINMGDKAIEGASRMKDDFEDVLEEAKDRARNPLPAPPPDEGDDDLNSLKSTVAQMQGRLNEMNELQGEIRELKQLVRQVVGQSGAQ